MLNSNTESPYLIWNNCTRAELLEFLESQQENMIKKVCYCFINFWGYLVSKNILWKHNSVLTRQKHTVSPFGVRPTGFCHLMGGPCKNGSLVLNDKFVFVVVLFTCKHLLMSLNIPLHVQFTCTWTATCKQLQKHCCSCCLRLLFPVHQSCFLVSESDRFSCLATFWWRIYEAVKNKKQQQNNQDSPVAKDKACLVHTLDDWDLMV